jgi:hypothetical protein
MFCRFRCSCVARRTAENKNQVRPCVTVAAVNGSSLEFYIDGVPAGAYTAAGFAAANTVNLLYYGDGSGEPNITLGAWQGGY